MGKRRRKLIKVTGPKLRLTSKGVKLRAPRARVGGKVGLNISKSGMSGSVRTGLGSYNTKRGCTTKLLPCLSLVLVLALVPVSLVAGLLYLVF